MALQQVPGPAIRHYELMQRLQRTGVVISRRAWDQIDPRRLSESWAALLPLLAAGLTDIQLEAALAGTSYSASTLASRQQYEAPAAFVAPEAFAGTASDGRDLIEPLYTPVIATKQALLGGATISQALTVGRGRLDRLVHSTITDTARASASVDITTRTSIGYVRMLNPPSCSRCALLAGRFYRWNKGFDRHPQCDCIHVPSKNTATMADEGLVTDPYEYFHSLTPEQQARYFGKSEARAIRDGSDIYQVVNARRGMTRLHARPGGRARLTYEGTSRHGNFGRRGLARTRLTVDEIYRTAGTRTRALRMLEDEGYILPGGQEPGGSIAGPFRLPKNASRATKEAWITGLRDPTSMATMTEAEKRRYRADRDWQMVRAGMNPYQAGAAQRWRVITEGRGTARGGSLPRPLTDDDRARAEAAYRRYVLGLDGGDTALGTRHTLPAPGTRI